MKVTDADAAFHRGIDTGEPTAEHYSCRTFRDRVTERLAQVACETVMVPRDVLRTALWKARREYVRVAEAHDSDPGPEDECWAEFEALAHFDEVEQNSEAE